MLIMLNYLVIVIVVIIVIVAIIGLYKMYSAVVISMVFLTEKEREQTRVEI